MTNEKSKMDADTLFLVQMIQVEAYDNDRVRNKDGTRLISYAKDKKKISLRCSSYSFGKT